jgi:high-affinity Fe2+/Pb2+ permease
MSEMRPATKIEATLVIGFWIGLLSGFALGFLVTWWAMS